MPSSSFHIPFPRTFLSLNSPTKKSGSDPAIASPETESMPHNFLSNRDTPRHSSISSESSAGTAPSLPGSPSAKPVSVEQKVTAFLTLNSKFVAPPATDKDSRAEQSPFLSNRR